MKICGVVDRDFRSEQRLTAYSSAGCEVLGLHEAESYLCIPELLLDASKKSGASVSREDIVNRLASICAPRVASTALRRSIARSEVRLSVGPIKGEGWPKDSTEARASLNKWITSESPRAAQFESSVTGCFEEELALCEQAVEQKDAAEMLKLFPGKEILKPLLTLAGFQSQSAFEKSVYLNLSAGDYPQLVEVREAIERKLF
jgi:hypothetical protein